MTSHRQGGNHGEVGETGVDWLGHAIAVLDQDGRVIWSNQQWPIAAQPEDAAGWSPIGRHFAELLGRIFGQEQLCQSAREGIERVLQGAGSWHVQPGGDESLTLSAWRVASAGGATAIIVGATAGEQDSNGGARGRLLRRVETLPVTLYVRAGTDGATLNYVGPRIRELLGYTSAELIALEERGLSAVHQDDREHVAAERRRCASAGTELVLEYRWQTRDETVVWFHDAAAPVQLPDGRVEWHGMLLDVTERRHREEQLIHQAFHDPLTGLPSRALCMHRLDAALARSRRSGIPVAVLFLDLDRFKVINDSLGHTAGDRLLVAVGERLRSILRPSDTAARLGGDEFVIVVEDVVEPNVATGVASRIISALRLPFALQGQEVYTATSVGIALSTPGVSQTDELIRDADIALYRAKAEGRSRLAIFDDTIDRRARERMEQELELRRAIDHGELLLHYQPVVSLDGRTIVAAEALLRWQHPTRGVLLPAEFLALAEETGLMTQIGAWLLREACTQARAWHAQATHLQPLAIVVNLSPSQFRQPNIVDMVMQALEASGLAPGLLRLEITESVLLHDTERARATIGALKRLGVQLAIDGFGMGYSSLGHLAHLPLDTLEIDRSFVSGAASDGRSREIIQAITSLAHALGAGVSAEGVETDEQLARVMAAGCDRAQGHYFSVPLSAADLSHLLVMGGVGRRQQIATESEDRLA